MSIEMKEGTEWRRTEPILRGVTQSPLLQRDLFLLSRIPYIDIVLGSMLTVLTTIGSQTLDSLMYFFLAFLFLIDPRHSTSIDLKMLTGSLFDWDFPFSGYMAQL